MRGWLCNPCNTSEGFGHPEFYSYRSHPPAVVLGVEEMYPYPDAISFVPPASIEELARWQDDRDRADGAHERCPVDGDRLDSAEVCPTCRWDYANEAQA